MNQVIASIPNSEIQELPRSCKQNQITPQQLQQLVQNNTQQQPDKPVINGWISYITLGTFRIDDGQSIEALFPPNSLTVEEKKSIAMISFPDTQSLNQGKDIMQEYCFRMKIRDCQQLGFVFFYRKKDPSIDRGYIQKSIVIITKLPLINFYQQILQHLGEMIYEQKIASDDIIQQAVQDIESWPEPENSKLYKLEFLGSNFTVSIPSYVLKDTRNKLNGQGNSSNSPQDSQNSNRQDINQVEIQNSINQNYNNDSQIKKDNTQQILKSQSYSNIRMNNNLRLNDTNKNREDNHNNNNNHNIQLGDNFFSVKNINNHKINFQTNISSENQVQQSIDNQQQIMKESDNNNNDLPNNIEIFRKQRSNSLETKQEFCLTRQIKQKSNLSEILKLNDAQEEGLFQEINIFRHVQFTKLHSLWSIWEMVLINQPFLLTADSPSECSAAILGFISLISPLQFSGDYRPYFTVYDTEYKKINVEYESNMLRTYILGTCNPLFQLTMKNFPAIVGIDAKSLQQQQLESKKSKKPLQIIKYNKFKSDIIADNKQLEKLLLNSNTPEAMAINNTLVRKHFRLLTNLFLEPIHKYLEEQPNSPKIFEEKSFLVYLKKQKSSIKHLYKEKSQLYHLYERFLRSLNFIRFIINLPNVKYQNPFTPIKKQ